MHSLWFMIYTIVYDLWFRLILHIFSTFHQRLFFCKLCYFHDIPLTRFLETNYRHVANRLSLPRELNLVDRNWFAKLQAILDFKSFVSKFFTRPNMMIILTWWSNVLAIQLDILQAWWKRQKEGQACKIYRASSVNTQIASGNRIAQLCSIMNTAWLKW